MLCAAETRETPPSQLRCVCMRKGGDGVRRMHGPVRGGWMHYAMEQVGYDDAACAEVCLRCLRAQLRL
eukprot:4216801-Alexandrium_andersonii.AAC.1